MAGHEIVLELGERSWLHCFALAAESECCWLEYRTALSCSSQVSPRLLWYMADGLRMIIARSCYRHGVFSECQATVNHDTESLHVVGHRQIDASHRYRRHGRSNGVQLIRSADDCPGSAEVSSTCTIA